MKDNKAMLYGAIVIVAILVFVGAAIAVSMLTAQAYNVSLKIIGNNTAATIYPYQSTAFDIVVSNLGSKSIVGLPVAFYVNGAQKNYSTYTIPAHQNITLEEIYTYTEPGSYLFSAAADPGNVLTLTNSSAAKGSQAVSVALPQLADVYSSMPNANIVYTDSFTTSGTGILSGSIMEQLYNVSALKINGVDNGILAKSYQDLYQYVAVANGAYSIYANGSVDYAAWLQGTLSPLYFGRVIASFGKTVTQVNSPAGPIEFAKLSNTISICSYYQVGWTKVIEVYNASGTYSCTSLAGVNFSAPESNAIVEALKATRIDNSSVSNAIAATGNPWEHFYYNNATVLGQTVEYSANSVGASTLFQLSSPAGIFLSTIEKVPTNVMNINPTCYGLYAEANGMDVCSVVLPTNASLSNQTFGAAYSRFISSNYTAGIYSLLGQQYLTLAHANAAELIGRLNITGPQVLWQSPFQSRCSFNGGFGCGFDNITSNGTTTFTITDLNYSSVTLDNMTCTMGDTFNALPISGTLSIGENAVITTTCHTIPVGGFTTESSFATSLGFTYKDTQKIVNGTLNVSNSGG